MNKNWITAAAAVFMMAGTMNAEASVLPVKSAAPSIEAIANVNPYMRKMGEKVYLNYLNLAGNTVTVRVFDENGRMLYIERFKNTPVVEKAFNFESAIKGTYRVEVQVKDGDSTYSESLQVVR